MGLFSCCLCGDQPREEEEFDEVHPESESAPSETGVEKEEVQPAVQPDDGGAPGASSLSATADEDAPLQLAAGRLARHLLERQPSKTKQKLQSSSFGGAAGQRWASNLEGSTSESPGHNGSSGSAAGGLLLQEVKPLYDPVAGPSASRLGAYSSLSSTITVPQGVPTTGSHNYSTSMTFARSVNRLSMFNTSGAFSRRASLLDMDLAKASLQLAMGSSLLRGSITGGSTHGPPPEPWVLHSILRQYSALQSPPPPAGGGGGAAAAAHSVSHVMPSGPFGQGGNFAPSSLPATASVMATIAAGLGHTPSVAGRQSHDREGSRSSFGQFAAHSPAGTQGQHALHAQNSAYPVPLFSRAVCERVEGMPTPLVVLVLRSAGADGNASGRSGLTGGGAGPGAGAGYHHGDGEEKASVTGDDDDGIWPAPAPSGPGAVVTSMKLDMPNLHLLDSKRPISAATRASRAPSRQQPTVQPPPSQQQQHQSSAGDAEGEARRRAYACLASALEEAAGRQVALAHAWHNAAAGALLATVVSAAATGAGASAPATSCGVGGGSESQQSQCEFNDAAAAAVAAASAAAALSEGGELGAVLWCLRELFEQDPCLPLLARDLLRQAAIRPEHVPPLTHSLVPTAYSALLGGRDPFSIVTPASPAPSSPANIRKAALGTAALQVAVSLGQLRVHVCVFQAPPPPASFAITTADVAAVAAESSGASIPAPSGGAWLPAIVLEWPQCGVASASVPQPHPPLPQPSLALGAPFSPLNTNPLLSHAAARLSGAHAQPRGSIFADGAGAPERAQSGNFMSLEQTSGPAPSPLGVPPALGSAGAGRLFTGETSAGSGSPKLLQSALPSLSFGIGSLSGKTLGGPAAAATDSFTVITAAMASGAGGSVAGGGGCGPFGSPASACGFVTEPGRGGGIAAAAAPMVPESGPELAPLAGPELLYVMQTWQRHHLLLASVPYAITLFDCGGRVLQQNQGSVDFMGEITGDPMEQHHSIAAAAASAASGLGSEARTSATFGINRAGGGDASGKGSSSCGAAASGVGSGIGGFGLGGTPLMDISEVDVLSVLFCLCPDLLDEMLEEVICGNMWRGIVQVPRVMRPCIRAAQRWGAAGKAAVASAQGSGPVAAAAAAGNAAAAATAAAAADAGGGVVAEAAEDAALEALRPTGVAASMTLTIGAAATAATATGPTNRRQPASPRNSCSSSSNTASDSVTVANAAVNTASHIASGLQHTRSFNLGRPNVSVASPLRRLATSLAFSSMTPSGGGGGSGDHLSATRLAGSSAGAEGGGGGDADGGSGGQAASTKRMGPQRRPPARSYSLRGLMRPMVNSVSAQQAQRAALQPFRAGAAHRLALGDGGGGAATATAAPAAEAEAETRAALPPPPRPMASRAYGRSSLGETQWRSFSSGHSGGLLPPRHVSEHLAADAAGDEPPQQQQPQGPLGGPGQLQQQLPKRVAPPVSPAFTTQAKPRSSVLAFAERIRSGRLPGGGGGGGSSASSGSGSLSGGRSAPRRLRSGLSLASGPDGPLPLAGGGGTPVGGGGLTPPSPFETQACLDSAAETAEAAEAEVEGTQQAMTSSSAVALVSMVEVSIAATETAAAAGAAAAPAAAAAATIRPRGVGPDGGAATAAASDLNLTRPGGEQRVEEQEADAGVSWAFRAADGVAAGPAAAAVLTPGGGGDGGAFGGFEPLDSSAVEPPPPPNQVDPRQLRLMSDPASQPVLTAATLIAEPRDVTAAVATAPPPARVSYVEMSTMDEHHVGVGRFPPSPLLCDGGIRPHHSVPLRRLGDSAGRATADGGPEGPPPPDAAGRGHSVNGAGAAGGGHARGGVRRQLHALKRPLSRTSTRTYLMTALPTSTLNVLGRVHSLRQMEYDYDEADGGDDAADGDGPRGRGGLLRASTTNMGLSRAARNATTPTAGVYRSKSQSLNVAAAEPRMAVPRIFSFMRSASKRMLQQMQGAQTAGGDGGDGPTAPIAISPQRRHTIELTPLDGCGRGATHRLSQSPRWSVDCPPRVSPQTRLGLETSMYGSAGPSASGSRQTGDGTAIGSGTGTGSGTAAGRTSTASEATLHKSSREHGMTALGAEPPLSCEEDGNAAAGAAAAAGRCASPPQLLPSQDSRSDRGSPPLPAQLSRLRASVEDFEGGGGATGVRMMSPREMSPADMARRVGMAWHEVAATSFTDPVTGARVVALVQNDVSEKVETEMQLTELMEVEHRLLEQIFPRHVLEHIAMQNISGAAAQHSQGAGGGGGGGGRKQRRMSQFDLLKSQDCSQLAHHHEQITILFCDVKGFTAMCSSVEPAVVMSFLNMLYTQFDSLLHVHDVYKGDCYMVAGGLVRRGPDGVAALLDSGEVDPDHARKVVSFAKELLEVVREMRMPNGQALQVRVGIHSGPAMSGVVGTKMPRFCLFGDTINTASRCESTCPPASIHATTAVRDLVPEEPWVATGGVMAKGKGIMRTFLLGPGAPAGGAPAAAADDDAVSDLCSGQPVGGVGAGVGVGMGSFHAPPPPPPPGPRFGPAAAASAALTVAGASAAGRHSALRRMASGIRRNSSLRAITTTSAAVAAAAAAAGSVAAGLPGSVSSAPPGSIAAAVIAAAAGGSGGSGSSGPASPSARAASGACVSSGMPSIATANAATTSGYLRLPSTVLSSSPADSLTTNTLVRNFAPAGELPYIAPAMDMARAAAAAAAAAAVAAAMEADGDSLSSTPHGVSVVNVLASQSLSVAGGDAAAPPGGGGGGVPPRGLPAGHGATPHGADVGIYTSPAAGTRSELGPDFLSSGAVVPPSGLLFDSGVGTGGTGGGLQAGALPAIVYEGSNTHEPQDLAGSLRAPARSQSQSRADVTGGGCGGASGSR
ncbi:hypothetical protein PLESTB_001159300 [Pleodorina starrii]|uniref:Guanylate cyclase domain-containing protein n=1 Tax=Pleodorina starrii TaxID=330485 RepID=A0A9W6F5Y0_9CHLO|nr:hypothetical protein PLESTM_000235900 [Pleodorina starrii]GLC56881.1 hypothetical protein PLESTB_001159300 [Pleodorina starrii]